MSAIKYPCYCSGACFCTECVKKDIKKAFTIAFKYIDEKSAYFVYRDDTLNKCISTCLLTLEKFDYITSLHKCKTIKELWDLDKAVILDFADKIYSNHFAINGNKRLTFYLSRILAVWLLDHSDVDFCEVVLKFLEDK